MDTLGELEQKLGAFVEDDSENYISAEQAISPELAGMRLYDTPLLGAARASDSLFTELKEEDAIGPHFMLPCEWMKSAKTVLSFFLPYTREIRRANAANGKEPAPQWLHGRAEGHMFLMKACGYLKGLIEDGGGAVLVPAWDDRFWMSDTPKRAELENYGFTSNWSERHIAFVCGLGTFGLSKGLITKAGMAGRFASLITDLELEPVKREYTGLYEYCTSCGTCIRRCSVHAISFERGKDHGICSRFLEFTKEKYAPRYGCGKCQTGVPCESRIPGKHFP